jgi:putative phosphoesterase
MKKILLLSDTHSHIDETILKYVNLADEVWHAGDIGDLTVTDTIKKIKPVRAVFGNIDNNQARLEFPLHNRFMCEGVDVWITHIGGYPDRYNVAIREEIKILIILCIDCSSNDPPSISSANKRFVLL